MKAIDILIYEKIIKYKIINYTGTLFKTPKFYHIEIKTYVPNADFGFSFIPFGLIEYNNTYRTYSIHYSKIYKIEIKNIYSDRAFKIKNKEYIINKINIKLYVDKEYQEDLLSLIKPKDVLMGKINNIYIEMLKYYKMSS